MYRQWKGVYSFLLYFGHKRLEKYKHLHSILLQKIFIIDYFLYIERILNITNSEFKLLKTS